MPSDAILADLPRIAALTRRMLALARAEEWDELIAVEAERRIMLDEGLHGGLEPRVLAACREQLQAILAMDAVIIPLVEQAKGVMGDELVRLSKGRKALLAYSS